MTPALDFSRFQAITFDCYGTLIDWETGILGAIRPILLSHGAELNDPEILRLYSELEAEAESSHYQPYREILRDVVRGFGNRLGFHATDVEQQSLPNSLANWKPFPDTVAALRQLKTRFKLGIISNVDDDLFSASARRLEIPSCAEEDRSPARAMAARRTEHLSRRDSSEVTGNLHCLGEPPVSASRSGCRQASFRKAGG